MIKADEIPDKYVDLIRYYHLDVKMSFGAALKAAQADIKKILRLKKKSETG